MTLLRGASLLGVLALGLLCGCSKSSQKVAGTSPVDVIIYDWFGQEHEASYYYSLVRDSHDTERFCYRCTQDPYLVDKNIDAVNKLCHAAFGRLEGQALVVSKLTEVLLEDPSYLAQANAANSLTKLGARLPRYPQTGPLERGRRFVQAIESLDGLHDAEGRRLPGEGTRHREIQLLNEIGNFRIEDLVLAKESVRPFTNRAYLIDETDPQIRQAIDTALTKRLYALIMVALEAAIPAESPWVRADAIRGLKTLEAEEAQPAVIRQMLVETRYAVQTEAVEFLGAMGDAEAVSVLLPLLDGPDGNLRFKAQQALARIAGYDYGVRRRAWVRWAHERYPEIDEDGVYVEPTVDYDSPDIEPTPLPPSAGATGPAPAPPTPMPAPVSPPTPRPRPTTAPPPPPSLPNPVVRSTGSSTGSTVASGGTRRAPLPSPPPPPPPPPPRPRR